jgi:O-antigen/teichoic acid export membrane protein
MKGDPPESGTSGAIPASPGRRLWTSAGSLISGSGGQDWLLFMIDQGVVGAASFLSGVIIGRAGGKEQLGLYALGMTIITLAMEVHYVMVWSPYAVLSQGVKGPARASYRGSTLLYQLALSAISLLGVVIVGLVTAQGLGPRGLNPVIWTLALVGTLIIFREFARRLCFADLKIKTALWLDGSVALFQVIGLLGFALLGAMSAAGALGIIGCAGGLGALGWFLGARKRFICSGRQAISDLRRNWSFGKWILGAGVASYLSTLTLTWALADWHGATAVGLLAACQAVVGLLNPFLLGTSFFLEPRASQAYVNGGNRELRTFVVKNTVAILIILSPLGILLFALGDQIVAFIYGSDYGGQQIVVVVLTLNVLLLAVGQAMYYTFLAKGWLDIHLKVHLLRLGISLTLGLWLVYRWELLGVILAFLVGNIVTVALYGFIFIKSFYPTGRGLS